MKGTRVRAILEDRGLFVFADSNRLRGFEVLRGTDAGGFETLARYDLDDSGHWRFGWTITPNGRVDALDWHSFDLDLQELMAE